MSSVGSVSEGPPCLWFDDDEEDMAEPPETRHSNTTITATGIGGSISGSTSGDGPSSSSSIFSPLSALKSPPLLAVAVPDAPETTKVMTLPPAGRCSMDSCIERTAWRRGGHPTTIYSQRLWDWRSTTTTKTRKRDSNNGSNNDSNNDDYDYDYDDEEEERRITKRQRRPATAAATPSSKVVKVDMPIRFCIDTEAAVAVSQMCEVCKTFQPIDHMRTMYESDLHLGVHRRCLFADDCWARQGRAEDAFMN